MKSQLTRRGFMKVSAQSAAGAALWGTSTAWAGANERVRVAVIGIRGMGQSHMKSYQALPNVEVVVLWTN